MTTKQAADIIRMLLGYLKGEIEPPKQETIEEARAFEQQGYECLEMAIKALEQQPCEDWYDVPSDEMTLEQARRAVKDLRKKLAEYLEQEPCDMKQRVEKEYLYESLCEDLKKANAEIKRLSEPFEDAISRQAVDELSKELVHTTRDKADFLCNFWEGLQKLPSVTPKEKIGWIPVSGRLPEEHKTTIGSDVFIDPSEEVLVQMKSGYMHVTRYWGSRERYKNHPWIDLNYPTTNEVIAWMPLPERYKDGE